jgi:hypothetical protein
MIKRSFKKNAREDLSSLIIFNNAITERCFRKTEIKKAFKELVDKEDYEGIDMEEILGHCFTLTTKKEHN